MKRSLPISPRGNSGGAAEPDVCGLSLLAGARRKLANMASPPASIRVHVRCRKVRLDGYVTSALRRYRESQGAYLSDTPRPSINRQA